MAKKYTHTAAFAHFGTTPRNVNWSWSARNEETKVVVVTLWQDEFKYKPDAAGTKLPYYDATNAYAASRSSPGFNELFDNFQWAVENAEGVLNVIIAIAKDIQANPRSISECFPSKMRMRVVSFEKVAGNFELGPAN